MQEPPPVPESADFLQLQDHLPPALPTIKDAVPALTLEEVAVQLPPGQGFFSSRRSKIGIAEVTCEVAVGSLCVVTGANGAGKSTLLRGLATLLPIASGSLKYFGQEHSSIASRRRMLSYCSDRLGRYDGLTVRELLQFFAAAYECEPERAQNLIGLLQHRLHLVPDSIVEELSLGQRQRVSLAKSLLHEAPLLLVDEPTNALDIDMASVVRQLLVELTGLGVTVIAATHDDHLIGRATQQIHLVEGKFHSNRLRQPSIEPFGRVHVD